MPDDFGVPHDTMAADPDRSAFPARPRILLADDAVAARVLTSALLRRMGFEVDVAEDGEAALALAGNARYDLILLDLDMPGMDGIATARKIRKQSGPDWTVPIVALSAYLADTARAGERRRLFDGAVAKPVTSQTLQRTIGDVLARSRAGATPAGPTLPAGSELPLIDLAALETIAAQARPGVWTQTLATMVDELRKAANRLEAAVASHDRDRVVRSCDRLKRISASAAPRLAERAAGLAAAARQNPIGELGTQAGEVIGCVVVTLGKLNKLVNWR
jgi:CheY-like chemotaxis protein